MERGGDRSVRDRGTYLHVTAGATPTPALSNPAGEERKLSWAFQGHGVAKKKSLYPVDTLSRGGAKTVHLKVPGAEGPGTEGGRGKGNGGRLASRHPNPGSWEEGVPVSQGTAGDHGS